MKSFVVTLLAALLPLANMAPEWVPPMAGDDPQPGTVFLPMVANDANDTGGGGGRIVSNGCVGEVRLASNLVPTLQLGDVAGARPIQYLLDEQMIAQTAPNVMPTAHPQNIYLPGWNTKPGATTQVKINLGGTRCLKRLWYYDHQGIGNANLYVSQTGEPNSWGAPIASLNLDRYQEWRSVVLSAVQAQFLLVEFTAQTGVGELLVNVGNIVMATATPTATPASTATPTRTPSPTTTPTMPPLTPSPTQPPSNSAVLEAAAGCASGWRVKLNGANAKRLDGSAQNAWSQAVGALLDEQATFKNGIPWSQWAPGFQSADNVDEALIDFGGTAQLGGVWVYAQGNGSGGDLDLAVHAGGSGNWVLPVSSSEGWQLHNQVSGTARIVRLKRNQPNENIREMVFCTGQQPSTVTPTTTQTPTPTPTGTTVPPTNSGVDSLLPKLALPLAAIQSTQYANLRIDTLADWTNWMTPTNASYYNTPVYYARGGWIRSHPNKPDLACINLHDRHWTTGPDGKAYHTWHRASMPHPDMAGLTCNFGHEHGLDPRLSAVFTASGGLPPFGYVLEQHHSDEATHHGGMHRHEDHVGNKVTFANTYTATFGNAANRDVQNGMVTTRIYDAGFTCSVLSKVHQGAHSVDAFRAHLHEYFLTVACNDAQNTAFSVKMLVPFGSPNVFNDTSLNANAPNFTINLALNPVIGLDGNPISLATQLSPITTSVGLAPNPREFSHFTSYLWKSLTATEPLTDRLNQVDLWTQIVSVKTLKPSGGTGEIQFGPYYIVKNPSRTYDRTYEFEVGRTDKRRVIRTIELCYRPNGASGFIRESAQFCQSAPDQKPAWNSPDSPFNGTYRAVNFKSFAVSNENGYAGFCTDVFGQNPSPLVNGACQNPFHIKQSSATITNHWNEERFRSDGSLNPNAKCAPGTNVCGITGSLLGSAPAPGGGYYPAGLGFELIVDQRNTGPIYGEN